MSHNKTKENRLVVIDGNSLVFRAYYAIQRPMMTKEGLYTHAVYGFINILQKIQREYMPSYIAVAFDRKAPTFRHEEFKEYKAGRPKMPPELAMQIPLLKEVLESMRIKILEIDGFEADDIIGTLAKRGEEEGLEPIIITGDKDSLQLASGKTKVMITRKGISEFDLYDESAMLEKYGFTADQYVDFKGLMGDASNNIPGIPGVGEKTAQNLIHQFGSIANLISNIEEVKSEKLKNRVEENIQLALLSRRLAEINTNVPIDINFPELKVEEPDYERLIEIYKKLNFNSFLKKLSPNIATEENQVKKPIISINSIDDIKQLETEIETGNTICLKVFSDNNHVDVPKIYSIAISTEKKHYYIDANIDGILDKIKEIFQKDLKIIGHQLQLDYYALFCNGFDDWDPNSVFDTAIAQYLLQPDKSSYDLNLLSIEYFHKDIKTDNQTDNIQLGFLNDSNELMEYSLNWCDAVLNLKEILEKRIEEEELTVVFEEIELPLIKVLASMEAQGFAVDKDELINAGKILSEQIDSLAKKIYQAAGHEFNINSPKQLGTVLFEELGLTAGKKNKTGYSTSAEVLESIRGEHEIIDLILEYRTLTKLNSTYIEGFLPLIHKDGKIHAHFQQTVTATGRISCTEPNLQNIPIRQEVGRNLRKAFIPDNEEYCLVGADYSQIELRVLAHMSEDPALIEAFNKGADIHKATASKVFGIPESEVTPLQRSDAKAVNFGVIYGMSSFGLATELNISRKQAEKYINEYFKKYTYVKKFMDKQIEKCKRDGYVTTIMNRKRPIQGMNSSNYVARQAAERLAMNSPIQGSAADIIKLAMIRCHNQLIEEGLKSRLILQVHDELIIHTKKDELERVKELLEENMVNVIKLDVNLSVDMSVGDNRYELK
ncbi:MAG: DNA polymerase I [Clostridiales bacterium]|nr:DNA polymerase I [Clostridiales bacterium]